MFFMLYIKIIYKKLLTHACCILPISSLKDMSIHFPYLLNNILNLCQSNGVTVLLAVQSVTLKKILDILFTFQMLSPFRIPSANPHPIPPYPASIRELTHPLPPHHPSLPLHWGIKPSQDQRPPLPLMPDKASSAPSVLPLTPLLGSLCSVRWLAVSIRICIG